MWGISQRRQDSPGARMPSAEKAGRSVFITEKFCPWVSSHCSMTCDLVHVARLGGLCLNPCTYPLANLMPAALDPDSSHSSAEPPKRTTRCGFRCPSCRIRMHVSSVVCVLPFWQTTCRRCQAVISTDPASATKLSIGMVLLLPTPLVFMWFSMQKWPGAGWVVAMAGWAVIGWMTGWLALRLKGKFHADQDPQKTVGGQVEVAPPITR